MNSEFQTLVEAFCDEGFNRTDALIAANQMTINYYIFDRIETDELGCHTGHLGDRFCDLYVLEEGDTEQELADLGYAKCDAPGSETMLVEESSWSALHA